MYVTVDILYDNLKEKYKIKRYGRGIQDTLLSLPIFYEPGLSLQKGKVYLSRTADVPALPNTECLFICVGSSPMKKLSNWVGEVLYIAEDGAEILTVFNAVQAVFDKIVDWECKMQNLIESSADIEKMVQESIPIFENSIAVTDYDLRMIANGTIVETSGHKEVCIIKKHDRVPDDRSMHFKGIHQRNIKKREAYIYREDSKDGGHDNYCVNLYLGEEYIGICSLMEEFRPFRKSDFLLFQRFANYIRLAVSMQSNTLSGQFITLGAIFTDLLMSIPVSQRDLNRVLENSAHKADSHNSWICAVIRSANQGRTLPEGYLCASLEQVLPNCTAISYEGVLVAFCLINHEKDSIENLCGILEPYLRDMNFLAGISVPFSDIFKVRSHFTQASRALETGYEQAQKKTIYKFSDYALTYMLKNSCGEFDLDLLISPGLVALRDHSGGVDYWDTLRRYLDNESNASKTSTEMFLHRSTLLPRIKKIKTFVDMDTPEQRLYLRICIHLCEILNPKK